MFTLRGCLLASLPALRTNCSLQSAAASSSAGGSNRQSKILTKLVHGKDKAKRRWYQDGATTPKLQSAASLSNPARQGKNAPRRVHVLNKMFMRHITDLMATGETADAILGRGLQISHVKVSADFNYVNVFWSTSLPAGKGESTDELEAILRRTAGLLRHELSQLRVMGEVPRINFVRDRQLSSDAALDQLLAIADYGDDYEPAAWTQVRQDMTGSQRRERRELPPMRHDVLGLNRAEIMGGIQRTMAKSRQAWENYAAAEATGQNAAQTPASVATSSTLPSAAELLSLAEQRALQSTEKRERDDEFTRFLEQRRYSRRLRTVHRNPDFKEHYERPDYDDDDELESRFGGGGDYMDEEDAPLR